MVQPIKQLIKSFFGFLFFYSGVFHLFRLFDNLSGKRLTIVTYHRISEKNVDKISCSLPFLFTSREVFEKQLHFLNKWYKIVSFDELTKSFIPWNCLIITFDDGYEDNYTNAYGVLKGSHLRATFFLIANAIGNESSRIFWWDRAFAYLAKIKSSNKELPLSQTNKKVSRIFRAYKNNYSKLFEELNKVESHEIEGYLSEIQIAYRIDSDDLFKENVMLNWEQVTEMSRDMEFGSHTNSHKNLLKIGEYQRISEIAESKKLIEEKLTKKIRAFSYPAGKFNRELQQFVQKEGYEFAVTTEKGINRLNELYALKRINVWEETSLSLSGRFSKGFFAYKLLGF
jgi:peptidoglycan/xylan/chitin deacetylase (PgdA/CDA1 family)